MASDALPADYTYDAGDASTVGPLLDAASAKVDEPFLVYSAFDAEVKAAGLTLSDELNREIHFVLAYELRETDDAKLTVTLEPVNAAEPTWPRAMTVAPADVRRLWRDLAHIVTEPQLKTRLLDVLLSSRESKGITPAVELAKAYSGLAACPRLDSYFVTLGLMRAATITRIYKLTAEESLVRTAMYDLADYLIREDFESKGTIFRLLESLALEPATSAFTAPTPGEVKALLERAQTPHMDLFQVDAVARVALMLAKTEAERLAALTSQARSYLDTAAAAEGAMKMHHLNSAAQLATRHGLQSLRDEAVKAMQTISHDDMEWEVVTTGVPIPRSEVEGWLRTFRRAADWGEFLRIFFALDAPSGRYASNLAHTRRSLKSHPLLSIFPTLRFGVHGLPQKSYADLSQMEQHHLVQTEVRTALFYGELYAEAISQARERFGMPGVDRIAALIVKRYGSDPNLAHLMGRTLAMFCGTFSSEAAHVIYPVVETGARMILLALDEPLYQVEIARTPGRFPSLDFYLNALDKHGLDPDWDRALRAVLLSDGSNLRNLTAHGFKHYFSRGETALLIRLAGLFVTIAPPGSATVDRETLAAYVRKPARWMRRGLRPRLGIVWR